MSLAVHYDAFSEEAACPKCRSSLLERTWVPERYANIPGETIPEHLNIECLDCGYSWSQKCADAK